MSPRRGGLLHRTTAKLARVVRVDRVDRGGTGGTGVARVAASCVPQKRSKIKPKSVIRELLDDLLLTLPAPRRVDPVLLTAFGLGVEPCPGCCA